MKAKGGDANDAAGNGIYGDGGDGALGGHGVIGVGGKGSVNGGYGGIFSGGVGTQLAGVGLQVTAGYLSGAPGVLQTALRAYGDVIVVGKLSKSAGSFKIDHPLDPANKYLSHSFVESPDMMNLYKGIAPLGSDGSAWVQLPDWFEALNQDFSYQLTSVGAPGPNLYIASTIQGNRFQISGGSPGASVSWLVTGTRHDAYADAHRIPVEEDKAADEKGFYLTPDAFQQPREKQIGYAKMPEMKQRPTAGASR